MHAFTAAHRTLPFGTRVRVRSVHTGKEVVVRINDRGPFRRGRVIDLSRAAINALGLRQRGVTTVELLRE
ncbi:Endolytic peptidoglycan transglycosylase RlpA [compost metagenome]